MKSPKKYWVPCLAQFSGHMGKSNTMIKTPVPVQRALQLLHEISPLSRPLETYLSAFFEIQQYDAHEYLLRNGEVCDRMIFIADGLVQIYCEPPMPLPLEMQGKEICNWFLMEGDLAISVESFFGREASDEYIRAIEPTTTVSISYDALENVYAAFPEFNYYGRRLTEAYYVKAIRQLKALRYKRAADSYRYLEAHCPNLIERVPVRHLAGYLGVDETYVNALGTRRKVAN
ncbi:Crp/Fnr family transcriptional regulator [Sediminibacterium soli]|uniref:Crp/Fnr family transcriptional regulator n=1 Tax=Sediminibacterium soli TaxID=2698829 RepID=UPI00137B8191|nr:Crp/Fnr family transcriptional regulator [Sediminibacterium soli]NCI48240.1 Crp/Fnr family transcriptional regulator [Sediminibacterium soli]